MAVKIRLARVGRKHVPIFRIVATDARQARDGEALENLGTYNAERGELVQYHADRIAFWVGNGAIVTDAVKKLQKKHRKLSAAAE